MEVICVFLIWENPRDYHVAHYRSMTLFTRLSIYPTEAQLILETIR